MSERLAIIDLGSNAVRLVLARVSRGVGFEILRETRARTRLGSEPGRLPARAMRETVEAAGEFLDTVGGRTPVRVLAIGTAALRDAANADLLRDALRRRLGTDITVLSGRDEARLGAIAALRAVPIERGLVFDLGGGSLQLSCVWDGRPAALASLPLGALRATVTWVRHDPPRAAELAGIREAARRSLETALGTTSDGTLIGIGGSIRALARVIRRSRGQRADLRLRARLTRAEVTAASTRLSALPLRERRKVPGLKRDRADTIVAGAVIVDELMAVGGWQAVTACARGVRHGLLVQETFRMAAR